MLHKQSGQTLIETMIAALIIAGSAIALLQFQNYLTYSNSVTQQQADAIQLAVNKIENLRDFSTIAGYNALASGSSTTTGTSASYNLAWTVTNHVNPNYDTIDVTVSWTDRYNNAQSVDVTSDVAGIDPSYSGVIM